MKVVTSFVLNANKGLLLITFTLNIYLDNNTPQKAYSDPSKTRNVTTVHIVKW